MNALFLILVVLGLIVQHVTKKMYSLKTNGGALTFSAISALAALVFFLFSSGGKLHFVWGLLPYAIGFALTYSLSIVFTFFAIKKGSFSLTTLITSYSLLIPTIYGLLFWNEKYSNFLLIGLILLVISIFFIQYEKKTINKSEKAFSGTWLLYVALAFIGGGGCSTVQKGQQIAYNGAYKNELMILALAITFIAILATAFAIEKKNVVYYAKTSAILSTACGLANGAVNYIVMILSNQMPASVMFPIISGGTILCTSVLSVTVYKEKLSLLQKIGVALGIASIITLNI